MIKDLIEITDFAKIDFRVGEVKTAQKVEGSTKLLKLEVFFGEEVGTKTIFSGIAQWYDPEKVAGRKLIFVINLQPKKFVINGVQLESQGMLVAAGDETASLYIFDQDLPAGSVVH